MTVLQVLEHHSIPYEQKETDNIYVECPDCGKLNLSINVFSGIWHCWNSVCEEKGNRGTFPLLAQKLSLNIDGVEITQTPPPKKDRTLTPEDRDAILHSTANKADVIEWASSRSLDPTFVLAQGIGYDTRTKAVVLPFRDTRGNLIGAKYRGANGDQWVKGQVPELYILDPRDLGAEKVIIVEGEVDALTLKALGCPVVATLGAGKDKGLHLLSTHRQIYLGYDMDEAGKVGATKASQILGLNRCKRITWLEKDPNDMLMKGMGDRILGCIKEAVSLATRTKSKNAKEALFNYLTGIEKGPRKRRSWGYPRLDTFTNGLGGGEFIGILAEAGTGKTTFLLNSLANFVKQGYKTGLASLEEHHENEITPKLFSTMIGRNIAFGGLTKVEAEAQADAITQVELYPGDGELPDVVEWIKECYYTHDVKIVAIDYLQLMIADEKDVQQIKEVCYTFKRLVKALPELTIILVIQPKQKQRARNKDGSEAKGLKMEGADARGGSAINQSVDKMLTITGVDGNPNITQYEYTKVRGHLHVSKSDWLNKFTQLSYDHATLRMTEVAHMIYGGA